MSKPNAEDVLPPPPALLPDAETMNGEISAFVAGLDITWIDESLGYLIDFHINEAQWDAMTDQQKGWAVAYAYGQIVRANQERYDAATKRKTA